MPTDASPSASHSCGILVHLHVSSRTCPQGDRHASPHQSPRLLKDLDRRDRPGTVRKRLRSGAHLIWSRTAHTTAINAVAYSPDGSVLATASDDHLVKLWRASDGVFLTTLASHYDGA